MQHNPAPLPVLYAPAVAPEFGRITCEAAPGSTVAQIVSQVLPPRMARADRVRVTLVHEGRQSIVNPANWHKLRPKPGVRVLIRTVPGKDSLRSILLAVVAVATLVFAPQLAAALLPGLSATFGTAIVAAGLNVLGSLLVNALIPIEQPRALERGKISTYALDGWRNERRAGAPVPAVFGQHRMSPPFAASSYTEIVGDDQYVRALFCFGYGPCRISDMRIGNSPVTDFDDIEIEQREGRPGDGPVPLFAKQVLEDPAGVDLVRPFPTDASGEAQTDQPSIEIPITRFTASNATEAKVLLGFQQGLYELDGNGNPKSRSVSLRIRLRLNGLGTWQNGPNLLISSDKTESFVREQPVTLPSRGRWQIEVTRLTDDSTSTKVVDKVSLAAIQSVRPEYPINMSAPLCLVAVRVRATHQLNGGLDTFNAVIEREGLVHEDGAWVSGYGRTPATAFLQALTGETNPFPVPLSEIDLEQIGDWHDWCIAKGLKYDRVHEQSVSLDEMLREICAAGRATYRHDGFQWGVVIDRPQSLVIDHVNPRNSSQFEWSRTYLTPPDGFRVRFLDETQDHIEAERVVPWPGHEGPIDITEALELPGKTDPDEIWFEARRRMYELIHRPDSFSVMQSGATRLATRGDLVMANYDVLNSTAQAVRVKAVEGPLIEVDQELRIDANFGARFKTYDDEEDLIGTSTVCAITAHETARHVFVLNNTSAIPDVGSLVHIGPISSESLPMRVRGIEAAPKFTSRLMMVAAAPEIDELLDAETPPLWDGRVGAEIDISAQTPTAPVFGTLFWSENVSGSGVYSITATLSPDPASSATLTEFVLESRVAGTQNWTATSAPAANGAVILTGFALADQIEIRAKASAGGLIGPSTPVILIDVGQSDPILPVQLSDSSILTAASLGHTVISILVPLEDAPSSINIYRTQANSALNRVTDLVTNLSATPGQTIQFTDGDETRTNLLSAPGFTLDGIWSLGTGWAQSDGRGVFTPGTAGVISQTATLTSAATYRSAITVSDHSAGDVRLRLTGANDVDGAPIPEDGVGTASLVANSGSDGFAIAASDNFSGRIDNAVLFEQTPTCLPSGAFDYWIEPLDETALPGPIAGPFTANVI